MITKKKENVKQIVEDFTEHKKFALKIQKQIHSFLNGAKGERVAECGTYIEIARFKDEKHTTKVHNANFCKNKLCPLCSWRAHLKIFEPMRYATEMCTKEMYHLVLTTPNRPTLDKQFLVDYKQRAIRFIKEYMKVKDYIMSMEITIGKDKMFHPHFHILLATTDKTPPKREMQYQWAKYLGLKRSFVILNMEKAKENTVAELTKYIIKFETTEAQTEQLKTIYFATKGLRRYSSAGEFKENYKMAKAYIEKKNMDEYKRLLEYGAPEIEFYRWLGQAYKKVE